LRRAHRAFAKTVIKVARVDGFMDFFVGSWVVRMLVLMTVPDWVKNYPPSLRAWRAPRSPAAKKSVGRAKDTIRFGESQTAWRGSSDQADVPVF
jgi:hypothetical protein